MNNRKELTGVVRGFLARYASTPFAAMDTGLFGLVARARDALAMGEGFAEEPYKPGKFERKAIRMRKALQAMRRCPGIDHTDQETGETFRFIVDQALKRNFPDDKCQTPCSDHAGTCLPQCPHLERDPHLKIDQNGEPGYCQEC